MYCIKKKQHVSGEKSKTSKVLKSKENSKRKDPYKYVHNKPKPKLISKTKISSGVNDECL